MVEDTTSSINKVFVDIKEDPWLPSYIEDILYIEMCKTETEDSQFGGKISRYYIEAAKYAGRISAGNFNGLNVQYKPVFQIHYRDFTPRLQAELLLLKKSPSTLEVLYKTQFPVYSRLDIG